MHKLGIPTVINYPKALPFYPAYTYLGHKPADFPVAFQHQGEILSIPLFPEIGEGPLGEVAKAIRLFAAASAAHVNA